MSVLDPIRPGRTSCLVRALRSRSSRPARPRHRPPSQTPLRFSLDGRVEGPSALFLLPLDRGYYKNESLNVTIDDAANAFEPITRVASGTYDMALADINAVIRFRDQNPTAPIRRDLHGLQPAAVRDRRPQEPRHQRSRRAWRASGSARRR